MRIVIVTTILGDAYGQERITASHADAFRSQGHEVFTIAEKVAGENPHAGRTYLVPGLSQFHTLSNPLAVRKAVSSITSFLNFVQPAVIHLMDMIDARFIDVFHRFSPLVFTAHTVAPSCPASQRLIRPMGVCSEQSGLSCVLHSKSQHCLKMFKTDLHRTHVALDFLARRNSLRKKAHTVAISQYIARTLLDDGWPEKKIGVIANPVVVPSVEKADSPQPLLVTASRLVELKGISQLLVALSLVEKKPWQLWICGDGPQKSALEQLSVQLGLKNRVSFLGRQTWPDTQRILSSATVYVQPNIGPEGFGLSAAEASAHGVSVVAFDVPALNEIVVNEQTGLLATPGDVKALAGALDRLLGDPALRSQLGQAGKYRMENTYSLSHYSHQMSELYRDLLKTNPPEVPKGIRYLVEPRRGSTR